MKLSSVLEAINFVVRAKKIWSIPKVSDVLIYDREGAKAFLEYLDVSKVQILDTRGESINILVLIKAIFKYGTKVGIEQYQTEYLAVVRPKVVLTFIDNTLTFYRLKKHFRSIRFVSVQNGHRDNLTFKIIASELNASEVLEADAIFCFGSAIGDKYSSIICSKIFPQGSFLNNKIPINKESKKKSGILFISQYRPPVWHKNIPGIPVGERHIFWDDFYATESLLLPRLRDLSVANGYELQICGTSFNERGQEESYYYSLLGAYGWVYRAKNNPFSSYEKLDSAEIIVFIDSTLGYESLGRGVKAMVFPGRSEALQADDRVFGWPSDLPAQGKFWASRVDNSEIERVFNYVISVDDAEWGEQSNKVVPKIMGFDEGNTCFVNLLKEYGIPTTKN